MSDVYRQTDTAAPLGVLQACAPVAPAGDADAVEAAIGGTAGVTALACAVGSEMSELCFATELAIEDGTSLDAGTLTFRLNVSTAQGDLTLEDIYVCRVNSSGVSQEELGSETGLGTDISAGGVFTQNITLSAASAHNAGDKVYIGVVVANAHLHTSRTIEVLPNQDVDTPFVTAAGAVEVDATTDALTLTEQPATVEGSFPGLDQAAFRGRNDDGSETAATWKAPINTDWSQAPDENFRVRFLIQSDAGNSETAHYQLEYRHNGGAWTTVDGASSVCRAFLTDHYVSGDDTTQQLGSGTYITDNNGTDETDGDVEPPSNFSGDDEMEFEFCVQLIGADVSSNDTVELRVIRKGSTEFERYSNIPTVTASLGTAVNAGTDALTLTENTAEVSVGVTVEAGTDSLTLTEQPASVSVGVDVAATTDSLTLTEHPATVEQGITVEAGTDALTLTEQAATVSLAIDVAASTEGLTLTEFSADVSQDVDVQATTGSLTLTEHPAAVELAVDVAATTDALTLTEHEATVSQGIDVEATTDALTLTEQPASVELAIAVDATTDGLTLTEHSASVTQGIEVEASTDALELTEQPATVEVATEVSAGTDALELTEHAATVDTTEGAVTVESTADSLTLSEHPATVSLPIEVEASVDALTLETFAALVSIGVVVEAGTDTVVLTEHSAAVQVATEVTASLEALTLTEYSAEVTVSNELDLRPPFTAAWIDPARTAGWTDPARTADWTDPNRTASWLEE